MIDWDSDRDPQLSALIARSDEPPPDRPDLDALRRAVRERARPVLERQPRPRGWRRWAARAGAAASLALAAGVAGLVLWRPGAPGPASGAGAEALVTAELSEAEFRALVSGAADTHSLLRLAAGER